MKLVPYTVMVPEHYATLMRETEPLTNGWAEHLLLPINQPLREGEVPGLGFSGDAFICIVSKTGKCTGPGSRRLRQAWDRFISAHTAAVVDDLYLAVES